MLTTLLIVKYVRNQKPALLYWSFNTFLLALFSKEVAITFLAIIPLSVYFFIEKEKKAKLIYSEIDLNPMFNGFAREEDRSNMNATFTLAEERLKDTFDSMWKEAGINGLNGHRSVGGYRASMYNALSLESVGVLVEVMSELERKA